MNSLILIVALFSLGAAAPTGSRPSAASHSANRASDQQRVWSNDDIPFLRQNAPISIFNPVVPAPAPAASGRGLPQQPAASRAPYIKEADPRWYEDEVSLRRSAIADIDNQLAQIAAAENGGHGTTNAFPLVGETPGILLPGTVYVLSQERRELNLEIADLQDLGQRNQIEPVAWR